MAKTFAHGRTELNNTFASFSWSRCPSAVILMTWKLSAPLDSNLWLKRFMSTSRAVETTRSVWTSSKIRLMARGAVEQSYRDRPNTRRQTFLSACICVRDCMCRRLWIRVRRTSRYSRLIAVPRLCRTTRPQWNSGTLWSRRGKQRELPILLFHSF